MDNTKPPIVLPISGEPCSLFDDDECIQYKPPREE